MIYRQTFEAAPRIGLTRRRTAALLGLQLGAVVFEGLGLSMLLPVFQFVVSGGAVESLAAESSFWQVLISMHAAVGIPITLAGLLTLSFLSILLCNAFSYTRLVYEARVIENATRLLRDLGFHRYLMAHIGTQQETVLGSIVNDLIVEAPHAVLAVIGTVRVAGAIILVSFYVILLTALSPWLVAASFVIFGTGLVLLRGMLSRSRAISREVTAANRAVSSFLTERLRAARLIRLSGTEAAEIARIKTLTRNQTGRLIGFHTVNARVNTVMEPIVVAAGFIMLYVGTSFFDMKLETIGLFLLIMLRLMPAVTEALRKHNQVLGFSASLAAVESRLASLEAEREDGGGSRQFDGPKQAIRFNHVSFDYGVGAEAPALRNITLEIPAGRTTALVGPSGSGKSTLIDLLPRLRNATGGTIQIDDTPLADFSLESLRGGIAYVPQSPQLFDSTVAEHIRYGNPAATIEEIRTAARLAGADDFIGRLPEGYDSRLGDGGVRLSGGERQRLDLARALARRASVLILDEPTSQLDADAEQRFREALRRIHRETACTIIVIAHRLSTVADADQIVVLDRGHLVGLGRHDALLRRGGWYAEAFEKQTSSAVLFPATGT